MKKWLIAILALLALPGMAWARGRVQGYCMDGNQTVVVQGISARTTEPKLQRSYPSCIVTVYLPDGVTLAAIYANDIGTAKANPFTAASSGQWFFYADDGRYGVKFSGGGITPLGGFTQGDHWVLDTARFKMVRNACDTRFVPSPFLPGVKPDQQIVAAITDLPVTGGTVDARCFEGVQTIALNLFNGVTKPVRLLLGAATFNASVAQTITSLAFIEGAGDQTVWNVTGATNGFTFANGADRSQIRNFKITGAAASIHAVAVVGTGGTAIVRGLIQNVSTLGFGAGAGVYLGEGAISWAVDDSIGNNNKYGLKCESTTGFFSNDHTVKNFKALHNFAAAGAGANIQVIGCQNILFLEPLSETTDAASHKGIEVLGSQGIRFINGYYEHMQGAMWIVGANGITLSEDVQFTGGLASFLAQPITMNLAGDRRTIIRDVSFARDDQDPVLATAQWRLSLSASTFDPTIDSKSLRMVEVYDAGSHNATILETPEAFIRNGGLFWPITSANLIGYSELLSNWTTPANITVTDNLVTAPDGLGSSASKVNKTTIPATNEYISINTTTTNGSYVFSVWLRSDATHRAQICINEAAGALTCKGVYTSNPWRRFYVVSSAPSTGAHQLSVQIHPVFTADAVSDFVYAWGAQFELSSIAHGIGRFAGLTDYVPNNTGAAITAFNTLRGLTGTRATISRAYIGPRSTAQEEFIMGNVRLNQAAAGNYAIGQDATGGTSINAATGQKTTMRINNLERASFSNTRMDMAVGVNNYGLTLSYTVFANINVNTPPIGTMLFCNDCTPATDPCTGVGPGALAVKTTVAPNWRCP